MDRQIVYAGQVPLETDLLNTNRNTMIALGKLAAAIFGTGGIVNGLAVGPTSPASLSVSVGAGEIYQLANVDDTAYGSLPADTTDTVVKQGILLQPTTLSCPAPSTSGFSINYLIEAKFEESDTGSVVLPYYNASNPPQAYSGPGNSGAAQAVTRAGTVSLQAKAGIAATTGTQTTPAVDAGYIALAVVTVANGQATITSGNITADTASILPASVLQQIQDVPTTGRLLNVQVFATAGTYTYTPTAGTTRIRVKVMGGGGAGGGTPSTTSGQVAIGGAGGAGGYAESLLTSGFSGASVVVGAAGVGASNANGGNGGASSFGAFITCGGGIGGTAGTVTTTATGTSPAPGGTASGGNLLNQTGNSGAAAFIAIIGGTGAGSLGYGASTPYGSCNPSGSAVGNGSSGAGNSAFPSTGAAKAGLNGAPGIVIIEEYA